MRAFELVLVVWNVLALFVIFWERRKKVRMTVAGVNLITLVVHGVFEGFRWQMTFSYIVVLWVILGLAAHGQQLKFQVPKVLRGITAGVSYLLLAFTAFLAYALPIFTLPKPTGTFAVGVKYIKIVDEQRTDPFLHKSQEKRSLMVKIYYPAKPDDSKPFASYFHGSTRLLQAWGDFYGMPPFLFDSLRLVKTHSKDDLTIYGGQTYPLVLFSHGAGTGMEVETSQSEDLASHGYVVVDIDHTYVSAATAFPDHIITAKEATTNFDTPEPAEPITQIMADDQKFVIEKLSEMNDGRIVPAFQGRLNLERIGVIGHSVGGAAAYNMAINDRRIKAAINLDGAVYILPKDSGHIAPFLMLANDKYHVQAIVKRESLLNKFGSTPEEQQEMMNIYGSKKIYETAYKKAQQNTFGLCSVLKESGSLYTIEGSDHMKFTDIGLFIGSRWLRERMQIGGKTEPARCLTITQSLTVAFFNRHLKGQSADALAALPKTYPELKKIESEHNTEN